MISEMKKDISYFTNLIQERIKSLNIEYAPANLYDPIRYILALGGKRLRPLLALLSFNLFSDETEEILDPAVAIEVFHNFTLMHDDIMDQAPMRRGMPTVHMKWDPNIAILSGDVMLVKAYELIAEVDDDILKKVLVAFNDCAKGVCEGQQIDMDFETKNHVDENEYTEMIRLKTAVLLGFSMELGGLVGKATDPQVQAVKEFGESLGIGFQIKDDILDVYGDHQKFGKQVGGDIIANKKTFLWINALDKAQEKEKAKLLYWSRQKDFDPTEKVQEITEIYNAHNVREDSEKLMNAYFDKALNKIIHLDVNESRKQILLSFAESLITRDH